MTSRYNFSTLFFEATRACNFACPMCMARSNDHDYVRDNAARELSTDEIEEHILARAHEIGVERINWSGGEFVLRPDATELVERATKHGYSSGITTNGSELTRDKLLELKEASRNTLVIAVGINSIEDENTWTRSSDCVLAVGVLELCEELGIRRNVVVTIGQHNLATLEPTLQWLEDRGIPFNRAPFTARGSGKLFWDELRLTRGHMERIIHPLLRRHALGYISYTPFFLSPKLHGRYSKGVSNVTVPQNPSIGCWCGTWLAVGAEGDVAPCGILLDEVRCGNVRERSLYDIVNGDDTFQRVLDRHGLQGKCGRCRYKLTCGGCRAMALFAHGDIMAEDPTCFFEPEDERTVSPHEDETNRMFKRYVRMARYADRISAANQRSATPAPEREDEEKQK